MLYNGHRLIAEESILIEQPCVCLTFSSAGNNKECLWLSRTFRMGNHGGSIQAISKCNQFSCLWWKMPSINAEYLSQGDALYISLQTLGSQLLPLI